jgi:hypothetical protein
LTVIQASQHTQELRTPFLPLVYKLLPLTEKPEEPVPLHKQAPGLPLLQWVTEDTSQEAWSLHASSKCCSSWKSVPSEQATELPLPKHLVLLCLQHLLWLLEAGVPP